VANVFTEKNARNDGIADVVLKMKWYSSLSQVILDDKHERLFSLRSQLPDSIVDFYTTILSYVIKCTCATYKGRTQIFKDMLKLNGWEDILCKLQAKETSFRNVIQTYNDERKISSLEFLVNMYRSTADREIVRKLFVIDMKTELQSLQRRKDDLIPESFNWILRHDIFRKFANWDNKHVHRRLWIKGKAGMGKTMLLIGIVQELEAEQETQFNPPYLSYFFCQDNPVRKLNSATAVLQGLIWMLLCQDYSLIQHAMVLSEQNIRDDINTFLDLEKIFLAMLKSPTVGKVYLVVDALDECIDTKQSDGKPGRSYLLDLISRTSKDFHNVKWLLSSRDELDIERILSKCKDNPGVSLELELDRKVLAGPIEAYINKKMSNLEESYIDEWENLEGNIDSEVKVKEIHEELGNVAKEMQRKADGTFLWVHLIFLRIKEDGTELDELPKLVNETPQKLEEIYNSMRLQIETSTDGNLTACKRALSIATVANRPLRLSELRVLAEFPRRVPPHKIVRLCRFFRVAEDDDNHETVYMIHQSAKQWLEIQLKEGFLEKGEGTDHWTYAQTSSAKRCLGALDITLEEIRKLRDPGIEITDIQPQSSQPRSRGKVSTQDQGPLNTATHAPIPEDLLVPVTYAVLNWFDHVSEAALRHDESLLTTISDFMKQRFLYWLEALSRLHEMGKGVTITLRLNLLIEVSLI
jgi:hypothetical protein